MEACVVSMIRTALIYRSTNFTSCLALQSTIARSVLSLILVGMVNLVYNSYHISVHSCSLVKTHGVGI